MVKHLSRTGMHNIWPAQPMFFLYLVCLIETPLEGVKKISFLAIEYCKKKFSARKRFELCTPGLEVVKDPLGETLPSKVLPKPTLALRP